MGQVQRLLESADFSRVLKARIFCGPDKPMIEGERKYRRDHLRSALIGMWKISTQPYGVQILLFKAVADFAAGANHCERAMRYILRALEEAGVLTVFHKANTVRRPATYELNVERLEELAQTYPVRGQKAHQASIASAPPVSAGPAREVVQISAPVSAPAATASPPGSPPRSESPPEKSEHRQNQRPVRRLTSREGPKLVNEMRRLMQGVKGHVGMDHLWVDYSPNDPRYRSPMSQENALIAACMNLGIPLESAEEFLKRLPKKQL